MGTVKVSWTSCRKHVHRGIIMGISSCPHCGIGVVFFLSVKQPLQSVVQPPLNDIIFQILCLWLVGTKKPPETWMYVFLPISILKVKTKTKIPTTIFLLWFSERCNLSMYAVSSTVSWYYLHFLPILIEMYCCQEQNKNENQKHSTIDS